MEESIMKEKYTSLDLEVIRFATEDIITQSTGGVDNMTPGGTSPDITDPTLFPDLNP